MNETLELGLRHVPGEALLDRLARVEACHDRLWTVMGDLCRKVGGGADLARQALKLAALAEDTQHWATVAADARWYARLLSNPLGSLLRTMWTVSVVIRHEEPSEQLLALAEVVAGQMEVQ